MATSAIASLIGEAKCLGISYVAPTRGSTKAPKKGVKTLFSNSSTKNCTLRKHSDFPSSVCAKYCTSFIFF